MSDYSYFEPTDDLETRINAHKKYSAFSLESFLENSFSINGKKILDIGCGNGNLTGVLGATADLYIGLEKNEVSIAEARKKHSDKKNILYFSQNMDDGLFLPSDYVDIIFFIFSVYYTNDPKKLFKNCLEILNKNGQLVLVGPTVKNASQLDDYCFEMFSHEKTSALRSLRIESEFLNILSELGFECQVSKQNFDLVFPNANEYFQYIKSTLQYRESFKQKLFFESKSDELLTNKYKLRLTKEVICLCAKK